MKNSRWIVSAICLIIGVVLFVIDFTKFIFPIGKLNVSIYPAAFFTLVGGILGIRNLLKNKAAD
jgi:hypothetical protein